MEYDRIVRLLEFQFYEDIKNNNGPSYITELILITIKSIIPSEDKIGVNIDYNRYDKEIKLWKYYRHGENTSLMNILEDKSPNIYYNHIDNTVYSRIIPIIITNKDYSIIKKEVIKNILFTTGNIEILIENILISKLLYLLIKDEEDVIDKLKEEIINLSQIELIEEYKENFKFPIEKHQKNYQVFFEQNRIYALNILNFSYCERYKVLKDSLEVIFNDGIGITSIGKAINSYIKDIKENINLDSYYKELSLYLCRLRKGRINPEALKIEKYYLPDVFQFNMGDSFYHSLLNKSKVIKKEIVNNKTIIYLDTKSGIYRFKK